MRLRFLLFAFILIVIAENSEASTILFNDRSEFDAALNGNYQLFTEFPINDLSLIGAKILAGNYGGLWFGQDFAYIGFGDALGAGGGFPGS